MTESMTEFRSGQPASAAHTALKTALGAMEKAKQNAVLWFAEILDRKLYRELGYSSINQYAKQELGFSASRTGDFLSICRCLKRLPKVKSKLESGELGYTHARELVKVADEKNQDDWLNFARENSRRELEREVKRAKIEAADQAAGQPSLLPVPRQRPAAVVPVRVCMEMSPTQFALYEALWERIRKQGSVPSDKVEALLELMASYIAGASDQPDAEQPGAKTSPRGDVGAAVRPPAQIHIHQCPDCEKATVQTGKGELELSRAEIEKARCDCQISRAGGRNTTSIPPVTRRLVLARDRHRCRRPGCGHTRFLEIHHIVPRSRGGTHDPANLFVLCSACHSLIHRQESRSGALKWESI